jgi:hypothetical protein
MKYINGKLEIVLNPHDLYLNLIRTIKLTFIFTFVLETSKLELEIVASIASTLAEPNF